jgi:hypothetical protein
MKNNNKNWEDMSRRNSGGVTSTCSSGNNPNKIINKTTSDRFSSHSKHFEYDECEYGYGCASINSAHPNRMQKYPSPNTVAAVPVLVSPSKYDSGTSHQHQHHPKSTFSSSGHILVNGTSSRNRNNPSPNSDMKIRRRLLFSCDDDSADVSDDDSDDDNHYQPPSPASVPHDYTKEEWGTRLAYHPTIKSNKRLPSSHLQGVVPRTVRTVSPEPPCSIYESVVDDDDHSHHKSSSTVYVAESMRGKCYHVDENCYGLRTASGTRMISHSGALLRGMRACRVCNPLSFSSSPSSPSSSLSWHEEEISYSNKNLHPHDPVKSCIQSLLVDTSSHTHTRNRTPTHSKNNQGSTMGRNTISSLSSQETVHIASSLKGKCYHSHATCYGLRSARGVTTTTLQNADMMGMRPCSLCKDESKKSWRDLENNSRKNFESSNSCFGSHLISTKNGYEYGQRTIGSVRTGTNANANPVSKYSNNYSRRDEMNFTLVSAEKKKLEPRMVLSMSSHANNETKGISNNSSRGEDDQTAICTYWTTASGKCYHSSRSCSSLRRSKSVKSEIGRPVGKRACKLCC